MPTAARSKSRHLPHLFAVTTAAVLLPTVFFSLSIPCPSSFPTWKNRTLGWVLFLFLSCSRTTGARPRQRHQSANFANVSPDSISYCTPRLNRKKCFHEDNIKWRKTCQMMYLTTATVFRKMTAQKPQPGGCPLLMLFGSKEGFSPFWMEGGEGKRGG